jgi:hypothetical protein
MWLLIVNILTPLRELSPKQVNQSFIAIPIAQLVATLVSRDYQRSSFPVLHLSGHRVPKELAVGIGLVRRPSKGFLAPHVKPVVCCWLPRGLRWTLQKTVWGVIIPRILSGLFLMACFLFGPSAISAQSASADDGNPPADSSSLSALTMVPSGSSLDPSNASITTYVPPTEAQKFHDFAWNALGPVALAGSSFAAAINQASDFPHQWGLGASGYSARVASNVGISLISATAQYSLAEAFHEDTAYYRCACVGFFPRFWHAAVSAVAARRGDDGHTSISVALTVSPFIGPMTAANTWIPSRDGSILGVRMGAYNLLGQFGQNEALEFFYGGPHTLLSRIQRRLFNRTTDSDPGS